jgi:hypothetical protein
MGDRRRPEWPSSPPLAKIRPLQRPCTDERLVPRESCGYRPADIDILFVERLANSPADAALISSPASPDFEVPPMSLRVPPMPIRARWLASLPVAAGGIGAHCTMLLAADIGPIPRASILK